MSTDYFGEVCRSLEANGGDICRMLQNEGRAGMQTKHWIWMVIVLAIGYYLGTKYPSLLSNVAA